MDVISPIEPLLLSLQRWFLAEVWHIDTALQAALILAAVCFGVLLSYPLKRTLSRFAHYQSRVVETLLRALQSVRSAALIWLLLLAAPPLIAMLDISGGLIRTAHHLLGAWIIIRFAAAFIDNPPLAKWLAGIVWLIAALGSLGWLDDTAGYLDGIGLSLGETRLTLLTLVKGVLAFTVVLWVANLLARISDSQVQKFTQLTPSLRVLIAKVLRVVFIVFAILIGLNTVGIDLTSLAVFSGAIGLGLGFGLQKVVSNFISGIILLLDRSIKPGDVIAIDDTYGWVNKLSARHVSVITRDGKEHLIPNELLITERVENWSYSDRNIRLKIPVGVSYKADPRRALALMLEAAEECPRVLTTPKPVALMTGFGDSSVDLELRCWIDDPYNGIQNIKSEVLLLIWDKLHEHGIEIPFPQRDVHIKNG